MSREPIEDRVERSARNWLTTPIASPRPDTVTIKPEVKRYSLVREHFVELSAERLATAEALMIGELASAVHGDGRQFDFWPKVDCTWWRFDDRTGRMVVLDDAQGATTRSTRMVVLASLRE